jgi:hypothetical protein
MYASLDRLLDMPVPTWFFAYLDTAKTLDLTTASD